MNTYAACLLLGMVALAVAEPPVTSYGAPANIGLSVQSSAQRTNIIAADDTSEGAQLDGALLAKVRDIILQDEQQNSARSSIGIPSTQYGVPQTRYRIVGLDLGAIERAIRVAQFQETGYEQGSVRQQHAGYSY